MESEPGRKRLKLSLTRKRPGHESSVHVGAAITEEETDHVATVEYDRVSATEATSELNKGDASRETQLDREPEPPSHTRGEEHREAYYSANFKSVLKTVLSNNPERHVIGENGSKVVERFMALPGVL